MPRKVLVISEIGVNHNGDMSLAKEMVAASAESGADIVKFQSFRTEDLVTRTVEQANYQASNMQQQVSDQYKMLKKLELSAQDHVDLKSYAESCGVEFLSSPFDYKSLDLLVKLGVKRLKIPSGEAQNGPLLFKIGQTGLPAFLSTGMGDLTTIKAALAILAYGYLNPNLQDQSRLSLETMLEGFEDGKAQSILKDKVSILHCTTSYPAPLETVNLRAMDIISSKFGLPVGYSDHAEGALVSILAVQRGAKIIEKHFTLDRNLKGPDHKASMEPEDFKEMVKLIRKLESDPCLEINVADPEKEIILGEPEKLASKVEQDIANVACKKLVFTKNFSAGDIVTPETIMPKRSSGTDAYVANDYWKVLGSKLIQDVSADQAVTSSVVKLK